MGTPFPGSSRRRITLIAWIVALVALVVVMALNTKVLTAEEAASVNPDKFDAAVYAADAFPGIVEGVTDAAIDIVGVAQPVLDDPSAAGAEYGNIAGTDKYAISLKATGAVAEADENFLVLAVDGMPAGTEVRVALAQAVNGTALRDALGDIAFKDFRNQTDYQQVANEFKTLAIAAIADEVDPAALLGKRVTVTGVFVTKTGPAGSFIISPVSVIEVTE